MVRALTLTLLKSRHSHRELSIPMRFDAAHHPWMVSGAQGIPSFVTKGATTSCGYGSVT
jgi:hypothetical protein